MTRAASAAPPNALNGNDDPDSPYRRMIRQAATQAHGKPSALELTARSIAVAPEELRRWLERILDTWRQVSGGSAIEPWDHRFLAETPVRPLSELIPVDDMQQLNQRATTSTWDWIWHAWA